MKEIEQMINSNDVECRYLAVSMLRNSPNEFTKNDIKLINKIPVIERIKNFSDVCKELNITEESCIIFYNPKNKEEKSINALNKIFKITSVYNGNDVKFPDFTNLNQIKYFSSYLLVKNKVNKNRLWYLKCGRRLLN